MSVSSRTQGSLEHELNDLEFMGSSGFVPRVRLVFVGGSPFQSYEMATGKRNILLCPLPLPSKGPPLLRVVLVSKREANIFSRVPRHVVSCHLTPSHPTHSPVFDFGQRLCGSRAQQCESMNRLSVKSVSLEQNCRLGCWRGPSAAVYE